MGPRMPSRPDGGLGAAGTRNPATVVEGRGPLNTGKAEPARFNLRERPREGADAGTERGWDWRRGCYHPLNQRFLLPGGVRVRSVILGTAMVAAAATGVLGQQGRFRAEVDL